jgi:phage tail-like protein
MPTSTVTAARFYVACQGWTTGLGFSDLVGFSSAVESHEYSYNGMLGNVHSKQFGRVRPPTITLKRGLDSAGFAQLFAWHALARLNNPLAKTAATFTIMDAAGETAVACLLENAWCAKLDIDPAQAGSSNVVMMKTTIECDSILLA